MMDMIDVKRREKAEELRLQVEARNKKKELERKALLKKQKIRKAQIKKEASKRGLTIEQVQDEWQDREQKKNEEESKGDNDDVSSLGGNTVGEVFEEKQGNDDKNDGEDEVKGEKVEGENEGDENSKDNETKDEDIGEGKVDGANEDEDEENNNLEVDNSEIKESLSEKESKVELDDKRADSKDHDVAEKLAPRKDEEISVADESMSMGTSIDSTTVDGDSVKKRKKVVTLNDIVEEGRAEPKSEKDSKGVRDGHDTNSASDSDDDETEQVFTINPEGEPIIFMMSDPDSGLTADDDDPRFLHSKEIITTTENLVTFSLFCGYTNLRMDQTPEDKTYFYEFKTDDEYFEDDEWLTHSFFLHITKERVDSIREATSKVFDPVLDSLDSKALNSLKLVHECMNIHNYKIRQPVRHISYIIFVTMIFFPNIRMNPTLHAYISLTTHFVESTPCGKVGNSWLKCCAFKSNKRLCALLIHLKQTL